MDPRTVGGFFIGYPLNSKGFRFYCPSHTPRIVEARNAKFLEDLELSGSELSRKVEFEEIKERIDSFSRQGELITFQQLPSGIHEEQPIQEEPFHEEQVHIEPPVASHDTNDTIEVRRSSRIRKPAISSDYVVYL